MFKRLCLILFFLIPTTGAIAQDDAGLAPLVDALKLHEIFDVMQKEGIEYGKDIDREMLGNSGGMKWQSAVEEVYESSRIWKTFIPRFTADLEGADIDTMLAFFKSDLGRRVVSLELSARTALLDKALEQENLDNLQLMIERDDPRLALLREFIEVNDLVEFNVAGSLNSYYAFYVGLIDGQAFGYDVTEEDLLKDVWSQEVETRSDTEEWLYSYLALAYAPLSDEELQQYIDFSGTKAGRALNAALFAGFDDVFTNVSKALGLSAASFMKGEDL